MRSGACVIGSMWPAPVTVTVDARGAARASPSATNSAAAGLVVRDDERWHVKLPERRQAQSLRKNRLEVSSDLIRLQGKRLLAHWGNLGPRPRSVPVIDEACDREHAVLIGTRWGEGSR